MRPILVLIIIVFTCIFSITSVTAQVSQQVVRGEVIDAQTEIPLIGATVEILTGDSFVQGATSDVEGAFRLEIPLGRYNIRVAYLGYESITLNNILVTKGKQVIIPIKLNESVTNLEQVVVSSKIENGQLNNEMSMVSGRSFSLEEVTRFAGTINDISRMAANYAGVMIPDNQRNDIIIRGNSPIGLLWRLEGVPIANPNHFSTLGATGGAVSAINPNILSNSDFLTGAFPAEYGNTTAGVFDLGFRSGNKEVFEFTGQLAAFSGLEFTAEGPLSKDHNSSFLIGYRHSFLELLDITGLSIGLNSIPNYKDLSFKFDFAKGKAGKWSLFGIGGSSDITFGGTEDKEISTSKIGTLGINNRLLLNSKSYINTTVAYSASESSYVESVSQDDIWKETFADRDLSNRLSVTSYFHKKIKPNLNFRTGLTSESYFLNVNSNDFTEIEPAVIRDFQGSLTLLQPYVQTNYTPLPNLTFNVGVHAQYLTLNNDWAVEPRIGIDYKVKPNQTISFGYGLHNQMQPLPIYFYETSIDENTSLRTNEELDFTRSNHLVLGYNYQINDSWRIKTDAYYQNLSQVPVESTDSYFSAVNIGAGFSFPNKDYLINEGTGHNYGLELTVEKFFSQSYYGLLTVSLMDSKYKGSDNIERNTGFNNGYIANFLAGKEFQLKKDSDNRLTVDVKLTMTGGRYYTPIDTTLSAATQRTIRDYSKAYSEQFTPFFRLDTKLGYRINSKKRNVYQHLFVEFQNITNHKNPLNNYYSTSRNSVRTRYQLGFFFDLLYRIQF